MLRQASLAVGWWTAPRSSAKEAGSLLGDDRPGEPDGPGVMALPGFPKDAMDGCCGTAEAAERAEAGQLLLDAAAAAAAALGATPPAQPGGRQRGRRGLARIVSEEKVARASSCSVADCLKRSRGASGLCRTHGGGSICTVKGCTRFSRVKGRCSIHGGAQLCLVAGCERRPRLYGRCTAHGGFVDCAEPGCELRAVLGGRCARHGGRRKCGHPGCELLRARARDEFCASHTRALALLHAERDSEPRHGQQSVPCSRPALDDDKSAEPKPCGEAASTGGGPPYLRSTHAPLARCGTGHCSWAAEAGGRCLEHAEIAAAEGLCLQQFGRSDAVALPLPATPEKATGLRGVGPLVAAEPTRGFPQPMHTHMWTRGAQRAAVAQAQQEWEKAEDGGAAVHCEACEWASCLERAEGHCHCPMHGPLGPGLKEEEEEEAREQQEQQHQQWLRQRKLEPLLAAVSSPSSLSSCWFEAGTDVMSVASARSSLYSNATLEITPAATTPGHAHTVTAAFVAYGGQGGSDDATVRPSMVPERWWNELFDVAGGDWAAAGDVVDGCKMHCQS